VDYFERAKRLEEIPLLQKSLEEKQVQDKAFWEQQEKERIQQLMGKHIAHLMVSTRQSCRLSFPAHQVLPLFILHENKPE
jgi:hypothetical protein